MTKISKQTKLKAVYEYLNGIGGIRQICRKYHIANREFEILLAAYRTHGTDALFNPPIVTPEFRVQVAS